MSYDMERRKWMARSQKRKRIQGKLKLSAPHQPGRASEKPFCAYLSPDGTTCAQTRDLQEVFVIEGSPRLAFLACPQHHEEVCRQIEEAWQRGPQTVVFQYEGDTYQVSAERPGPVC